MEFLYIFGIIFVVFGLSFLMINIRKIATGQDFRGTCATNNPMVKNNFGDCTKTINMPLCAPSTTPQGKCAI